MEREALVKSLEGIKESYEATVREGAEAVIRKHRLEGAAEILQMLIQGIDKAEEEAAPEGEAK